MLLLRIMSRICLSLFSLFSILIFSVALVAKAEDLYVAEKPGGDIYRLQQGPDGILWNKVDPVELKSTLKKGYFSTSAFETQLAGDGRSFQFRRLTPQKKGKWKTIPLPDTEAPVLMAIVDGKENFFLKTPRGYHFISHDGAVLLKPYLEENGFPKETIVIAPFLNGTGCLAVTKERALYKVVVKKDKAHYWFETTQITKPKTTDYVHSAGVNTVVDFQDGTYGVVKNMEDLTPENLNESIEFFHLSPLKKYEFFGSNCHTFEDTIRTAANLAIEYYKIYGERAGRLESQREQATLPVPKVLSATEFRKELRKKAKSEWDTIEKGTSRFLTEEVMEAKVEGREEITFGRENESLAVLDTLIRLKGRNPVLVGEAGVGKTEIAKNLAKIFFERKLPEALLYQELFKDVVMLETSPSQILSLAKWVNDMDQVNAVREYLDAIMAFQEKTGINIILYVDEVHRFRRVQWNEFKTAMSSRDGISFIGSTTHREFGLMVQKDNALKRRLQAIPVREFTVEETRRLLMESVLPKFQKTFGGEDGDAQILSEAVDAAILRANEYAPHTSRPEGPIITLQDALIAAHRKAGKRAPTLTAKDVGQFVSDRLRVPLDPTDLKNFYKQIEKLRQTLREEVVDQARVTDAMADLWQDVMLGLNAKDSHRVLLVAGPTGAGKTFSAQTFARIALGDEERMLELDGTKYKRTADLWTLLGAVPGHISSNRTRGVLPEFLSGKGQGVNVIVINELDKACPQFIEAIMEMLDTGKLVGNDGNTYFLGKSLIVLTTNKGDDRIYPRGRGQAISRAELEKRLDNFRDQDIKNFLIEKDPKERANPKQGLPPSIAARIHRAVPAGPPSREGAIEIAEKEANRLRAQLYERHQIQLELGKSVLTHIVDSVYVPEDGVRNILTEVRTVFERACSASVTKLNVKTEASVKVFYEESSELDSVLYQVQESKKLKRISILGTAPLGVIENALLDPLARGKLKNLQEGLEESVFGQSDAAALTAKAVRSRAANPERKRPASFLYLGPTGTGKTEMAKALTKKLFGDSKRMFSSDMGKIRDKAGFNEIFGSPGGTNVSAFEQFLLAHPEGGTVLFDEIGNMGSSTGSGRQVRESLLKFFYTILDEGTWKNAEGKVYDLSRYAFVFTSNEGQEEFEKYTNDEQRLQIWEDLKRPENIIQLLRKHDWPEPLIARFMGNIALFKPLLKNERAIVSKKLVHRAISPLLNHHGVKSVKVTPQFYSELAETFFSHKMGARSIEGFSEQTIVDLLTRAIYEKDDPYFLKGATIRMNLSDSFSGQFLYSGNSPPKREVILRVEVESQGGEKLAYEMDVTNQASTKMLHSKHNAIQVAVHEAGHAIVNDPKRTGRDSKIISIERGGDGTEGAVTRSKNPDKITMTRNDVVAMIGALLAGREAERFFGFQENSGWISDRDKAQELAKNAVLEFGLAGDAYSFSSSKNQRLTKAQEAAALELLKEGESYARERVEKYQVEIQLLTNELVKKGVVKEDDFLAVRKAAARSDCSSRLKSIARQIKNAAKENNKPVAF